MTYNPHKPILDLTDADLRAMSTDGLEDVIARAKAAVWRADCAGKSPIPYTSLIVRARAVRDADLDPAECKLRDLDEGRKERAELIMQTIARIRSGEEHPVHGRGYVRSLFTEFRAWNRQYWARRRNAERRAFNAAYLARQAAKRSAAA